MNDKEYLKKYLPKDKWDEGFARLENGEPVQYIIGNVDFYGYIFEVNRHVLIPRFETEELISKTISYLKDFDNPRIADIGTGSGCIGITLKKEILCRVEAVDISPSALIVANRNAENNKADITFLEGSFLSPLTGKYDCIISNPPYLSYGDDIMEIVSRNEPAIALYAEADGLACYDAILKDCSRYLNEKYLIAFEIGETHATRLLKKVKRYLPSSISWIEKDMQGRDRFLFIKEG